MKQDLRYAVRQLRRDAGFSAVVIATLALGIGGTTAVFSVMHAVLLAPLPYPQPDQLVRIYQESPTPHEPRRQCVGPTLPALRTRRRRSQTSARATSVRGTWGSICPRR